MTSTYNVNIIIVLIFHSKMLSWMYSILMCYWTYMQINLSHQMFTLHIEFHFWAKSQKWYFNQISRTTWGSKAFRAIDNIEIFSKLSTPLCSKIWRDFRILRWNQTISNEPKKFLKLKYVTGMGSFLIYCRCMMQMEPSGCWKFEESFLSSSKSPKCPGHCPSVDYKSNRNQRSMSGILSK